MSGRESGLRKPLRRAFVVASLLFVAVILITWAAGVMTGWPGSYSDRFLAPGTLVTVTDAGATVVCPDDWTCRVVDYVPLPRWSGLGLGAEVGLRQAVFLTSGEMGGRKTVVIARYHSDAIWQERMREESRQGSLPLDLSGTVFAGRDALGYGAITQDGPGATVYVPMSGNRGGTMFTFTGDESTSSAIDLVNDIAASVQLQFGE